MKRIRIQVFQAIREFLNTYKEMQQELPEVYPNYQESIEINGIKFNVSHTAKYLANKKKTPIPQEIHSFNQSSDENLISRELWELAKSNPVLMQQAIKNVMGKTDNSIINLRLQKQKEWETQSV